MAQESSLVIRGGMVVDGSGAGPVRADVAIRGDRIVAVGGDIARGDREIDADGHLVIPGLVDPHTHYDAQLTWANCGTPSTMNGVTTLMMGNCGVGFAPCAKADRHALMYLMEGVEDIPLHVMEQGIPWQWTSFPQFMDFLGGRQYDADICTQVPHSAVRVFVMGERALERGPSSDDERAQMRDIVAQAVRAGAMGFSTSRSGSHRTPDGRHIPSYGAAEGELAAAADGLREADGGWLQLITDFDDADAEFAMLRRLTQRAGRPMTISMLQKDAKPELWRYLMGEIAKANAEGLQITGQVSTRATGVLMGFELSENPFYGRAGWKEIAALPFERQLQFLRDPAFRQRLCGEATDAEFVTRHNTWTRLFPLGHPVNYEPQPHDSVAARAAREGRTPDEVAYDLMMQDGGRGLLYRPMSNYSYGNLDAVRDMLTHPNSLVGLGDGGAHVGHLCDSSVMTYMLTHWARDRALGELFPIGWAVKRLTRDNALGMGLRDRGLIAPGMKADINVIDHARMQLGSPHMLYDLPGGGKRLVQSCEGILTTLVSGVPVHWSGQATGDLPGRLVRGAMAA